jgi:hypothetical protein
VPQRGKFRQGFYDVEVFERTDTGMDYRVAMQDSEDVRREYIDKGFRLNSGSDVNSYFIGFNMLDPVIGDGPTAAQSERNRKLRQAISMAIDWEEYSKIFPKKAGDDRHEPAAAGHLRLARGHARGCQPGHARVAGRQGQRRRIDEAQEADGRSRLPQRPRRQDRQAAGAELRLLCPATPERKPEIDWVVRQFAKINIQLEVRATDNNQFQDKVRKGKYQVFWLGWNADYPDAENFLFLLYGPARQDQVRRREHANYANAEYDRLFAQMKSLDDGPAKQQLIDKHGAHRAGRTRPGPWASSPTPRRRPSSGCTTTSRRSWSATTAATCAWTCRSVWQRTAPGTSRTGGRWLLLLVGGGWVWWWVGRRTLRRRERTTCRAVKCWPEDHANRSMASSCCGAALRLWPAHPAGCEPGITFFLFFTVNTPDDMARLNLGGKRVTQAAIEKWKVERGYDKPLYFNDQAQGTEQLTETIFWERSVSLFALRFGRADSRSGRRHRPRGRQRMGVSLQMALPLFVLQVIASTAFALLLVMFRGTRGLTSGAWSAVC